MMDDTRAELITSKAQQAEQLTRSGSHDIRSLYLEAQKAYEAEQAQKHAQYLSLVPTFLSLHQQATTSNQLLDSLQSFLSTFQTDLSTLSSHISALQITSNAIDTRLESRRDIEVDLSTFLSQISLSPRIIDLFFETEPEQKLQLWHQAIRQLERVIEATKNKIVTSDAETKAVKEAKQVAEACKNLVAAKLRTFLISSYSSIKSSVTTNMQVLQTSILLKQHRPFYAFLARQMPRVAIDVQRSYVTTARLYFETAFRRYARSLSAIKTKWVENTGGLITDPVSSSTNGGATGANVSGLSKGLGSASGAGAAAMAFLSRPIGGNAPLSRSDSQDSVAIDTAESADAWLFDLQRLQNAKLDGPGIVLGYMADDPTFRASPETLFRSISLVMVDNACSEYTFLVRFFENLEDSPGQTASQDTPSTDSVPTKSSYISQRASEEESVDPDDDIQPSVVQLSRREQSQMQGHGATEEVFKQIMEPAITTWITFTKSLLSPPPPFFSLLTMVKLNSSLLKLVKKRGTSTPLVESCLIGFNLSALPLLKRILDDHLNALCTLSDPSSSSSSYSQSTVTNLFKSAFSSSSVVVEDHDRATLVSTRYAHLFSKTIYVLNEFDDSHDEFGICSTLLRIRNELEKFITKQSVPLVYYSILLRSIENGPCSLTHPRIQSELSHWNELVRICKTIPSS